MNTRKALIPEAIPSGLDLKYSLLLFEVGSHVAQANLELIIWARMTLNF